MANTQKNTNIPEGYNGTKKEWQELSVIQQEIIRTKINAEQVQARIEEITPTHNYIQNQYRADIQTKENFAKTEEDLQKAKTEYAKNVSLIDINYKTVLADTDRQVTVLLNDEKLANLQKDYAESKALLDQKNAEHQENLQKIAEESNVLIQAALDDLEKCQTVEFQTLQENIHQERQLMLAKQKIEITMHQQTELESSRALGEQVEIERLQLIAELQKPETSGFFHSKDPVATQAKQTEILQRLTQLEQSHTNELCHQNIMLQIVYAEVEKEYSTRIAKYEKDATITYNRRENAIKSSVAKAEATGERRLATAKDNFKNNTRDLEKRTNELSNKKDNAELQIGTAIANARQEGLERSIFVKEQSTEVAGKSLEKVEKLTLSKDAQLPACEKAVQNLENYSQEAKDAGLSEEQYTAKVLVESQKLDTLAAKAEKIVGIGEKLEQTKAQFKTLEAKFAPLTTAYLEEKLFENYVVNGNFEYDRSIAEKYNELQLASNNEQDPVQKEILFMQVEQFKEEHLAQINAFNINYALYAAKNGFDAGREDEENVRGTNAQKVLDTRAAMRENAQGMINADKQIKALDAEFNAELASYQNEMRAAGFQPSLSTQTLLDAKQTDILEPEEVVVEPTNVVEESSNVVEESNKIDEVLTQQQVESNLFNAIIGTDNDAEENVQFSQSIVLADDEEII